MPTPNAFTWTEIPAPDLDRAGAFYSAVFGWTIAAFVPGEYAVATVGETMICGLYRWETPAPDGVRVYVSVNDLEATLAAVADAGGATEHPRTEISPEMGWWADFRDPFGTLIGLTTDAPAA